jgi:hypothetical protein
MKKISLTLVMTLFISITVFGVVVYNHVDSGYNDDGSVDKAVPNPLKKLIITGAGQFIQSHAGFQQFLHQIELAELYGVDFVELRGLLNETIANIDSANITYYDFIKLAGVTPYNPSFIAALETFDYDGFREKHNLNTVIFSRLVPLLRSGNLTGVIEYIYAKTGEISRLLGTVKSSVDKDIFPGIPVLWQINQVYFDAYLFGQYAAMIFNDIK